MNYKFLIVLSALAITATGCSSEKPVGDTVESTKDIGGNTAAEDAVQLITEEYIREIIVEISDDKYEGRGPASAGDIAARKYLADRMADLGLEPGGDNGSWEQPFDLVSVHT